jgi:Raf kinase inhibitor-like YbhB/YbcL family protein
MADLSRRPVTLARPLPNTAMNLGAGRVFLPRPLQEDVMVQSNPTAHAGSLLAIQRIEPFEHRGVAVVSDALNADGVIDDRYSAYHDDEVPGLGWSAVIEAQSYALIVEDPDAPMARPFVHWLIWNIPGDAIAIPQGLPRTERPDALAGAVQGLNSAGEVGWHGTKPPPGHGKHRYHFQLFALSGRLDHLPPRTSVDELVDALKGLTIASGEIVGTYERLNPAIDRASPGRTGGYGPDAHADTARETATGRGGLDADDLDRHAPHTPEGEVRRP